jgi:hypothetical protein
MFKWLAGPWAKLQTALAIAGAVIVAIGIAFLKGRKAGVEHIQAEQQRKRDALQDEYDRIDAGPVDPGGAYDRLRKRSGGR